MRVRARVVSVIVQRPVLPPCVVDGLSRNLLLLLNICTQFLMFSAQPAPLPLFPFKKSFLLLRLLLLLNICTQSLMFSAHPAPLPWVPFKLTHSHRPPVATLTVTGPSPSTLHPPHSTLHIPPSTLQGQAAGKSWWHISVLDHVLFSEHWPHLSVRLTPAFIPGDKVIFYVRYIHEMTD